MSSHVVVFEIDIGNGNVRTERIDHEIIKIGSLSTSHLTLNSPTVAGIHAVIEVSDQKAVLTDLGSVSGTSVNQTAITRCELKSGDVLEFGDVSVVFRGQTRRELSVSYRKHYSRRFLSQPSRADGAIEVAVLWKDNVMAELTLGKRDRGLSIGSKATNDIVIDDPAIERPQHLLVSRCPDGSALLHLTGKMSGEIYINGSRHTISDVFGEFPSFGIPITEKTRARLFFGDVVVYIHQATKPKLLLPMAGVDTDVISHLGVSAVLHAILLVLVFLVPHDANSLEVDSFSLEDDFVVIESMVPESEPEEVPLILQHEPDSDGEDDVLPEMDGNGRPGEDDEEREDRRLAVEGDPDNERVEVSRVEPEEAVRHRSALAVVEELSLPTSAFGRERLGYDAVDAYADWEGESIGPDRCCDFGELGDGSGGSNPNGFGIGPISTAGHFGPGDGGFADPLDEMTPREERPVEVTLCGHSAEPDELIQPDDETARDVMHVELRCAPPLEGQLDREVIRRVVREHHREIRECYNQQYQSNSDLAGRVVVSFTVASHGDVVRAEISESDLDNDDVEDCLVRRFRRFRFPEAGTAGLIHVYYPFVFTGSD